MFSSVFQYAKAHALRWRGSKGHTEGRGGGGVEGEVRSQLTRTALFSAYVVRDKRMVDTATARSWSLGDQHRRGVGRDCRTRRMRGRASKREPAGTTAALGEKSSKCIPSKVSCTTAVGSRCAGVRDGCCGTAPTDEIEEGGVGSANSGAT